MATSIENGAHHGVEIARRHFSPRWDGARWLFVVNRPNCRNLHKVAELSTSFPICLQK
jgi:hypothetical protein